MNVDVIKNQFASILSRKGIHPIQVNWKRVVGVGAALGFLIFVIMWYRAAYKYIPDSTECDMSYLNHPEISELLNYCNQKPMTDIYSGAEGKAPTGYRLEAATIIIRHGDRVPLADIPNYSRPKRSCKMEDFMSEPFAAEYLKTMKKNVNKRSPEQTFHNWEVYPNSAECESGYLTPQGALQLVKIGSFLNKVYFEKWKILNINSSYGGLYFRSTNVDRTYQSGLALLSTLLPRLNVSLLRIDEADDNRLCTLDTTIETDITCPCLAVSELSHVVSSNFEIGELGFSKLQLYLQNVYQELSNILELPTTSLPVLTTIADNSFVQMCHREPLPGHEGRCLSANRLVDIYKIIKENSKKQQTGRYLMLSRLKMHPLLSEISSRMKRVIEQKHMTKVSVYSGHDSTIDPLITALGIHTGDWPQYASRLIFELYSQPGSFSKYFIRVIFNGNDVTPDATFCKGFPREGCPFARFLNFTISENLRDFNSTDYSQACSQQIF